MPRLTFPRFAAPVLVAVALGLSACGGSDDAEQADATVPQTTRTDATPTTPVTTPTTTVPTQTTTTPAPPPQTTATQPPVQTTTTPPQNGGATTPARPRPRTTPQQTGGATGPSACGNVAGGFISGVQASGTACGEATSVANDWLGQVGESGPEADVVAGGYACSGRRSGDATAITCIAEGGRRITFSANN